MSAISQISFPQRKRRAGDPEDGRPPSERIARKASKHEARRSLLAQRDASPLPSRVSLEQGVTMELHRTQSSGSRSPDNSIDGTSMLSSPSTDDEARAERFVREHVHAERGAGNSLIALHQSIMDTGRDKWPVAATCFELHTPKFIKRQVRYHLKYSMECKRAHDCVQPGRAALSRCLQVFACVCGFRSCCLHVRRALMGVHVFLRASIGILATRVHI